METSLFIRNIFRLLLLAVFLLQLHGSFLKLLDGVPSSQISYMAARDVEFPTITACHGTNQRHYQQLHNQSFAQIFELAKKLQTPLQSAFVSSNFYLNRDETNM